MSSASSSTTTLIDDAKGRQKYLKGEMLGKGGFAKVYRFTQLNTNRVFAGKCVAKSSLKKERAKQKLLAEIKIHRGLRHRHVVRFFHFFEDKHSVYIVLELCKNQTLMELMKRRKRLAEHEVQCILLQLLDGVRYLHSNNVIHRDLKLGNLFLSEKMELRIGDFGLAAKLAHANEKKKTICGTPNYIAPEILDGKGGHSFEVDVWSIGVIMFTMLVGKPPFETRDVKSTYKRIRANAYSFPPTVPVSENAKSLIRWILNQQPERRPNLDEIVAHPFFAQGRGRIPRTLPVSALRYESMAGNTCSENRERSAPAPLGTIQTNARRDGGARPADKKLAAHRAELRAAIYAPDSALDHGTERRPSTALATAAHSRGSTQASRPASARPSSASDAVRNSAVSRRSKTDAAARRSARNSDVAEENLVLLAPMDGSPPSGGCVSDPQRKVAFGSGTLSKSDERRRESQTSTKGGPSPSAPEALVGKGNARDIRPGDPTVPRVEKRQGSTRDMGRTDKDLGELRSMHQQLEMSLVRGSAVASGTESEPKQNVPSNGMKSSPQSPGATTKEDVPSISGDESLWVKRWVDYTSKYGLGYLLRDGSVGVYFNDSTKIILSSDGENFEYMERVSRRAIAAGASSTPSRESHTLESFPGSLQKKVTLLKHFKGYLEDQEKKQQRHDLVDRSTRVVGGSMRNVKSGMTYVKKWVRTRHAIFFRLSNRTVQVAFFDHTEIILSSEAKLVTYLDKHGVRSTMPLAVVMKSERSDIAKRLKYTKDILHQLITSQRR